MVSDALKGQVAIVTGGSGGIGTGLFGPPNLRQIVGATPKHRTAPVGGMVGTNRLTGQSIGAALAALVLAQSYYTPDEAQALFGQAYDAYERGDYAADRLVIDDLERLGISYDEVVQVLEDEGVAKFEASWSELQDTVTAALKGAAK